MISIKNFKGTLVLNGVSSFDEPYLDDELLEKINERKEEMDDIFEARKTNENISYDCLYLENRVKLLEKQLEIDNKEIAKILEDNLEVDLESNDFEKDLEDTYNKVLLLVRNKVRITEIMNHYSVLLLSLKDDSDFIGKSKFEFEMFLNSKKNLGSIKEYSVKVNDDKTFISLKVFFKNEDEPVYFLVTEEYIKFSNLSTFEVLNLHSLEDLDDE